MTASPRLPALEEIARRMDGLYAGQMKPEEYEPLIEAGYLRRSFEGAGGFLGLSKLRYVSP